MSYGPKLDDRLDATFAALADGTRRAILERLALGEATVNELATPFKLSQPTISKHLKVLERAGLISCGRDAQRRPRSLIRKPLEDATAWLKGYRNPGTLLFSTPGDCEVVMKRSFAAGRDLVFDAFVRPELLKQWFFGKPGGTLAVCEVALKAGDAFRYVWRDADGSEMGMRGVCLEFVRSERIVATEEFDVRWYPGEAVGTISLEERDGLTALTQTIRYESRAARDMVLQTPMEHGIALGYDRLAKLLESIEAGKGEEE
jgi:uncharacterized protein YndB with AHSA1/START domain/DNA-binding transcriptional ArsR family regulator